MDSKRKVKIGFLISILIVVFVCNSIAQGTNTPCKKAHAIKLPETISYYKLDNGLLNMAGKRLFLPVFQTNRNTRVFRVITTSGELTEDKKQIPYVRSVINEFVMLEVVYHSDRSMCAWRVDRARFPLDKTTPNIVYSNTGTWDGAKSREWFRLLWRCEIFSLPSESIRLWDDGSLHLYPFQEVPRTIYVEKSTDSEYVLLERLWSEKNAAIDILLDQLRNWFPDAGFPSP